MPINLMIDMRILLTVMAYIRSEGFVLMTPYTRSRTREGNIPRGTKKRSSWWPYSGKMKKKTVKNAVFGMWRRVVLVWTDVSEERIASIFRVETSASEDPAWAGGCRLSASRKQPGQEGRESGPQGKSIGRGEGNVVGMGQQVAGQSRYRSVSGGGGKECLPSGHWSNSLGTRLPSVHGPAWPCRSGVRILEGADEGLPWLAETKTHHSVHILVMELNFNGLPNDAIHVLGLSGEDGGIMKSNAVFQVDAVFSHGWLVWMFKTDVPLMLLQPRVYIGQTGHLLTLVPRS
jgi:hypothetical protein